ncbi:hypothetical protein TNCV_2847311 [Trichonephila clavipes]|nr:hypothetical protein TNCV_2847311 [Trichonephila clavipes]
MHRDVNTMVQQLLVWHLLQLERYKMSTRDLPITVAVAKVKRFYDSVPDQRCLILINVINAHSLVSHSEDISTDSIISRSHYFAISEILMEDSMQSE